MTDERPTWECPDCGARRASQIQLNHVHDGRVVPWTHVAGPAGLDLSGRFSGQKPDPAPGPGPAPVRRRPGRPRKTPAA